MGQKDNSHGNPTLSHPAIRTSKLQDTSHSATGHVSNLQAISNLAAGHVPFSYRACRKASRNLPHHITCHEMRPVSNIYLRSLLRGQLLTDVYNGLLSQWLVIRLEGGREGKREKHVR